MVAPGWQRAVVLLAAPLLLVGALELAALVLEGGASRDRMRASLQQLSRSLDPITDQLPCPWSDPHVIYVRAPAVGQDQGPFKAMGRLLTPHFRKPRQVPMRHAAVSAAHRPLFVVGGSAAFGYPYALEQSLAARLQAALGSSYRVINAAQPGWTSGQQVELVRRLARFSPHAVVLFLGNNEWIHWNPPHLKPAQQRALGALRLSSRSRLLSWMAYSLSHHHWVRPGAAGRGPARENPQDRLDLFSAGRWLEDKQRFLQNLEQNLDTMIMLARAAGARVYVLTMPFNYRLDPQFKRPQPFTLVPGRRSQLRGSTREVTRLLQRGQHHLALDAADRALTLDGRAPLLHHLRGEIFARMGRFAESEQAYALAREHTVGNLGSMLSVNRSIRRVARAAGATLVDVRKLFDEHQHALGRYFNQDLIHDECHPTPAGHELVARTLAREILGR